ncbi:NAD(P)/FAD-dependent oxidoreductase [Filimonas effusa]|uniref:NAD(P)/FAD-dependent oxidoreductase n=1 Tax=Filimonas effusa TaxID=2508721 RepID=A0A4Q1D3H8_9BACT|nr:NAD(P)/FAD-dependent oxidoreductase [Filimonas effusa]RXK82858.1 NAD(P)/FAD-dependent oxidoreductase [Filimonas effusa]
MTTTTATDILHASSDVIIIGGSYSGLSAAMALGRALRDVLIIDSGLPCNRQTPYSHNFVTQDGKPPQTIADEAKAQVLQYHTVRLHNDLATAATKTEGGFRVQTQSGQTFSAKKLLFATGVKDIMPAIPGFAESWGISALHCPYCHGYEVRHQKTGVMCNGELGFDFARLIANWTGDLTLFTNGPSTLHAAQTARLAQLNIPVIETTISALKHTNGYIKALVLSDGNAIPLDALYARIAFEQHCALPVQLGCQLTEQGYLQVDNFQRTTIPGVFACGDNSSFMRAVSAAVASGTMAGAMINREMVDDRG